MSDDNQHERWHGRESPPRPPVNQQRPLPGETFNEYMKRRLAEEPQIKAAYDAANDRHERAARIYARAVRVGMVIQGFTFAWAALEADTTLLKVTCWVWVGLTALTLGTRGGR